MERDRVCFVGDDGGEMVAEEEEGKGMTLTLVSSDSKGPRKVAFSREMVHVGGDLGTLGDIGIDLGPFGVLGIGIGCDLDSPFPWTLLIPTPTSEPSAKIDENLPRALLVGFSVVTVKDFRFWEVPFERM